MRFFNAGCFSSLLCVLVIGLKSPCAHADVADYWQKISQKKTEDVRKIYQKRIANEGVSSKFIKQSTIYLSTSANYYEWKNEIINDLLTKIDTKVFFEADVKESVSSYIQKAESDGRYISLKSFLEVLLFKNKNFKKNEPYKFEIALKLAQADLALMLFSDAESVFLNSMGEENIFLEFWKLYFYTELLINIGKLDKVQGFIQKLTDLAKASADSRHLSWVTLLESKFSLQRNESEQAYKKALEMKVAFEKLDVVRINQSQHPYYIFSIVARRFNKTDEAMKAIESADKITSGKTSLIEQFWYKLSRLKILIKMGTHTEAELLQELNNTFQLLEKTEVEDLYKVYKIQYQKIIQKTLNGEEVRLAFSKSINYFENQEILSFLSRPI